MPKIYTVMQHFTHLLQWRIYGRGSGSTLFLGQTEAQMAKKNSFREPPHPLFQGLDDRAPHVPEGLDPPLCTEAFHLMFHKNMTLL